MLTAGLWGLVAASSLVVGALAVFAIPISRRALGLIMGFGSGVLISALAYELVEDAFSLGGGSARVAMGLAAGALAFFAGDLVIDRAGGEHRKRSAGPEVDAPALAIVLGIVLDGVPESVAIGVSLLAGGTVSAAMVAAVFLSNVPEAVAATSGLTKSHFSRARVLVLWIAVALVSAFAAAAGYVVLGNSSPAAVAFSQAFAGGAILTMLADTMMPEAFEYGGATVGLMTVLGFSLAFMLTNLK